MTGTYIFDLEREPLRLADQARIVDPITERLFVTAGLGAGMRVLDLGTGAGSTAILASKIVGPSGNVVGLDASSKLLGIARTRVQASAIKNVSFMEGDVTDFPQGLRLFVPFDAIVGRFILQFVNDPVDVVRSASSFLKADGLVCFHEADNGYDWSYPLTPLWREARMWYLRALEATGTESRMGVRLYQTFRRAGFQSPRLQLESPLGENAEALSSLWAGLIRGALPVIVKFGIASMEEVGVETLAERLMEEMRGNDGVVLGPLLIGGWATRRSQI